MSRQFKQYRKPPDSCGSLHVLQHADAQRHTGHKSAKLGHTKLLHVRGNIIAGVIGVTAGTSIAAAGSDGTGGDARPMGGKASKSGDGPEVIGSMVIWRPTRVPIASADMDVSGSGPDIRDCTRQVAHVVRYLSVKGSHNARQRMQSGVCYCYHLTVTDYL